MKTPENYSLLIIKHFDDELTEAEEADFKRLYDNDPNFVKAVNNYKMLEKSIFKGNLLKLKETLDEAHQEYVAETKNKKR
jgi:hypothetical protein